MASDSRVPPQIGDECPGPSTYLGGSAADHRAPGERSRGGRSRGRSRHRGATPWRDAVQQVFDNCPIVVSAPAVFFWAGEHVVLDGGLAVIQQIPLRVYVGIQPVQPVEPGSPARLLGFFEEAETGTGRPAPSHMFRERDEDGNYVSATCDFRGESRAPTIRKVQQVADLLLADLCSQTTDERGRFKYRVWSRSEIPPGSGANWSGAFATALTVAMLLAVDRGFGEYARNNQADGRIHWGNKRLPELVAEPSGWFAKCNRWAWILESTFHEGAASGYGTLGSLAPTTLPVVYQRAPSTEFSGRFPRSVLTDREPFGTISPRDIYAKIKTKLGPTGKTPLPFRAISLRDGVLSRELPVEGALEYPFFFGLIDSGWPKSTGAIIRQASTERSKHLASCLGLTRDLRFEPAPPGWPPDAGILPFMLKRKDVGASAKAECMLHPVAYEALMVDALVTLHALKGIYESSEDRVADCLETLLKAVTQTHGGLEQLGLCWPRASAVCAALHAAFPPAPMTGAPSVAAKLTGAGGGGCMVFACNAKDSPANSTLVRLDVLLAEWSRYVPHDQARQAQVVWHSGLRHDALPGVSVDSMTLSGPAWGRLLKLVPLGTAWIRRKDGTWSSPLAALPLQHLLSQAYLLLAEIKGNWQFLLPDRTGTGVSTRPGDLRVVAQILAQKTERLFRSHQSLKRLEVTLEDYKAASREKYAKHANRLRGSLAHFLGDRVTVTGHGPNICLDLPPDAELAVWSPRNPRA